ncbi:major membrane immunogen (membrane-anchored lipoprotein) [Paenibacillus shirakamiensis]|uniref:Major membrane immunogen (Membrane-anchored lipoprotein) n=1 Tax=Paenibacillus shirakamiensis TaxID=1265935 RepID=A0ABS4JES2_9BACL|nr:hypothetical protein [Paenibacillus shirakamiensis]MBP2000198.1 major membrane immunogen (membrane-anchored lipoprotein) [Paenibacillus shirakamiensis]
MKLRNYLIIVVLLSCTLLSGCNTNDTVEASTPLVKNTSMNSKEQQERDGQSLWFVIDESGNKIKSLDSQDPNVVAVNKVITEHSKIVDNLDYRSLQATRELQYYAKPFVQVLQQQGYLTALQQMYMNHQIILQLNQLSWYEMAFYKDLKTVRVKTESQIVIKQCSQDYLTKNKLIKGQTYSQPRIVDLQKEGGTWKITKIEKGPFVLKPSAPNSNLPTK